MLIKNGKNMMITNLVKSWDITPFTPLEQLVIISSLYRLLKAWTCTVFRRTLCFIGKSAKNEHIFVNITFTHDQMIRIILKVISSIGV